MIDPAMTGPAMTGPAMTGAAMTGAAMNAVPAAGLQPIGDLQLREPLHAGAPNTLPVKVGIGQIELHPRWPLLCRLPMRVSVGVALARFRVRDLLALQAGALIASPWPCTEDVPVCLGEVQLGWSEFEVVEQRMAVRLTRLA